MIAVVTGGCQGLGLDFTKELLNRGYEVIATYLTSEKKAQKLALEYPNLKVKKCDITNEEDVINLFKEIPNIDLLINNAALAMDNNYENKSFAEFMSIVTVNLGGTYLVTKEAVSKLKENSIIINISSNNSINNNSPLSMDYDASKAGINLLTKDFAEALENLKIKVVAVAPGWIATPAVLDMNPIFLKEEMAKTNQRELINPELLVKKIINEMTFYENGSVNLIEEINGGLL